MFVALGDLSTLTERDMRAHATEEYGWGAEKEDIDPYHILIGFENIEGYGGSAWFLLRHKKTGDFYEVYGSHCSCAGFEGQWEPEKTSLDYLKSPQFSVYYHKDEIKEFVDDLIV